MREKYFEEYVEFENIIRMIARKWKIKTKNISLFNLIKQISSYLNFPFMKIKSSLLTKQNNRRNWLAHSHKNSNATSHLINDFNKITSLNKSLLKNYSNQK